MVRSRTLLSTKVIGMAALLLAAGPGCVQSSSVACGEGVCPEGTTCVEPDICRPLTCGDGERQAFEACDDEFSVVGDCTDHGFYLPDGLTCGITCQVDTSECAERCGDHLTNGPESCDGLPPSGESCVDYGRDLGPIGCAPGCAPDLRSCGTLGWQLGGGTAPAKLSSIWGTDLANLYAVGDLGTIVRRVNGEWTTVPSTTPSTTTFNGLWGSAPDRAFAVGVDAAGAGTIAAFDGQTWTPMPAGPAELFAIDGDGTLAFAVGANGTILRNDGGTTWTPETLSPPPPTPPTFNGVYARGGIAVGTNGTVYRRTGTTWSAVTGLPAALPTLHAVTGVGQTVIAVGSNGTVVEFDGITWSRRTAPTLPSLSGPPDLFSLWLARPGEVFIGGGAGVVFRYDGNVFVDTQPPNRRSRTDMFGLDPQHVFTVSGGKVLEFDGSIRRTQIVDPGTMPGVVRAVVRLGEHDRFAGTRAPDGSGSLFRSTDGNTWTLFASTLASGVTAIWHDDGHIAFAAGELNYLASEVSPAFTPRGLAGTNAIAGVRGDVYAAGRGIHHCTDPTGATWTTEVPASTTTFSGVWSAGNGVAIAVGDGGTILRRATTGTWTPDAVDLVTTNTFLLGVWGTAPDNVYVVGNQGLLLRFDGTTWRRIPLDTLDNLNAVKGSSPTDVFVVGGSGVIFHFDGASWSRVSSPGTAALMALDAQPEATIIVGELGTGDEILRSCSATEQKCGDAWDDDCDGAINCADADCEGTAECAQGGACAPARALVCDLRVDASSFTGVARVDDLACLPVATRGTEAVYRFTASVSGEHALTLATDSPGLELAVAPALHGACDLGACVGGGATPTGRAVTFTATAGETYYVLVDGQLGEGADFGLELTCP